MTNLESSTREEERNIQKRKKNERERKKSREEEEREIEIQEEERDLGGRGGGGEKEKGTGSSSSIRFVGEFESLSLANTRVIQTIHSAKHSIHLHKFFSHT